MKDIGKWFMYATVIYAVSLYTGIISYKSGWDNGYQVGEWNGRMKERSRR